MTAEIKAMTVKLKDILDRDVIAAAIANARVGRRGVPVITNIMEILPEKLRAEVRDDADSIIEALTGRFESAAPQSMTPALRDVIAERERQKTVEGWALEHDDNHYDGSLAQAAACYALPRPEMFTPGWPGGQKPQPKLWPVKWGNGWWKPSTVRRNLVKAGALILAEIERIDRAERKGTRS